MTLNELIQACFRHLKYNGECDTLLKRFRNHGGLSEENEKIILAVVKDGKTAGKKF